MPEYCFLRRYSSKVSAFFAKFLLYFSRCTRSELLCRCHSFRLKSQDFSGLCSRRYIRAFPTICRCQRQTIPHRLHRKIQALLFIKLYYTFIFEFWQLPKLPFSPLFKFALLYCLSIKNAKVAIKRITYLTSLYGGKYAPY